MSLLREVEVKSFSGCQQIGLLILLILSHLDNIGILGDRRMN